MKDALKDIATGAAIALGFFVFGSLLAYLVYSAIYGIFL